MVIDDLDFQLREKLTSLSRMSVKLFILYAELERLQKN